MNKTLKLTFLVSIVLNVLLIGVMLGELPNRFEGRPDPGQRIEAAAQQLPEPARSRFRTIMEQARKDAQPTRDQIQAARGETLRLFAAEPFDEAAFDRAVNKMTEIRARLAARYATAMKTLAKELPAADRKSLARAFERSPRQ
jgi:uncharacterized membrane protein